VNELGGLLCMKVVPIFQVMFQRVTWLCTWERITRDMSSKLLCSTIHSSGPCWIKLRKSTISLQIQNSVFPAMNTSSSVSFDVLAPHRTNDCVCVSEKEREITAETETFFSFHVVQILSSNYVDISSHPYI